MILSVLLENSYTPINLTILALILLSFTFSLLALVSFPKVNILITVLLIALAIAFAVSSGILLYDPGMIDWGVPGVECPRCLEHGKTTWVIPGRNCPNCGHPC